MKKIEIEKPEEYLKLIEENKDKYLYHDHPSDGLDVFHDDILEDYGWQGITFSNITYRDIAEFIEDNCDGEFYFNDHPMGFNGFALISNIEKTREQVKEFIISKIKENDLNDINEDQKEALEFFNIK